MSEIIFTDHQNANAHFVPVKVRDVRDMSVQGNLKYQLSASILQGNAVITGFYDLYKVGSCRYRTCVSFSSF